jgi:hypothetical protein
VSIAITLLLPMFLIALMIDAKFGAGFAGENADLY